MNLPNKLTLSRIICTPVMVLFFLLPIPYGIGVFLALAVYGIACLTDLFDGKIARKYNLVTDFGKFADQIADKFLTTTALVLVLFSGVTWGWVAVLILLIVVLRDILVSGIRMLAAKNGTVIAADIYGKIKSFVLDVACMIMMFYIALASIVGNAVNFIRIIGLIGLIAGAVLTLISCINYTLNAKTLILDSLKDKNGKTCETVTETKEENAKATETKVENGNGDKVESIDAEVSETGEQETNNSNDEK